MRLILLGAPGSGKGTQGQRMAAHYGVPHISSGSIVRDHIARQTDFGRKVEAAISVGNFAPDEDIAYWIGKRLIEADTNSGYILDGFPRDLAQAGLLDTQIANEGLRLDAVVELAIKDAELVRRLSGRLVCPVCDESYHPVQHPPKTAGQCDRDGAVLVRRPDDAPEAIANRLKIYEERTLPLREYYGAQGLLRGIDALGSPDEVYNRIVQALE